MIEERMVRLQPSTCRFDIARGGGTQDLTPQDVAAAIAFVRPGLGREMLILSGWPDAGDMRQIIEKLCRAGMAEIRRQQDAAARAALRHALEMWHDKRSAATITAHGHWPKPVCERLPAIAAVAAQDAVNRHLCPACQGRGEVMSGSLLVPCTACRKTGNGRLSLRETAAEIGIDESTYRRGGWMPVYEWMLREALDALTDARGAFRDALR